jgi:hypothetical protein
MCPLTLPSVGLECVRDPVSFLVAFLGEADQVTERLRRPRTAAVRWVAEGVGQPAAPDAGACCEEGEDRHGETGRQQMHEVLDPLCQTWSRVVLAGGAAYRHEWRAGSVPLDPSYEHMLLLGGAPNWAPSLIGQPVWRADGKGVKCG